jgi:hypothetical protein
MRTPLVTHIVQVSHTTLLIGPTCCTACLGAHSTVEASTHLLNIIPTAIAASSTAPNHHSGAVSSNQASENT